MSEIVSTIEDPVTATYVGGGNAASITSDTGDVTLLAAEIGALGGVEADVVSVTLLLGVVGAEGGIVAALMLPLSLTGISVGAQMGMTAGLDTGEPPPSDTDFLRIAGLFVPVIEFAEDEPERIGDGGRTFTGAYRDMTRAEKRTWSGLLLEMTHPEVEQLRSVVALGAFVPVTGTAVGGGPVMCTVRIAPGTYIHDGTSYTKAVSIRLREV